MAAITPIQLGLPAGFSLMIQTVMFYGHMIILYLECGRLVQWFWIYQERQSMWPLLKTGGRVIGFLP